MADSEHKQLRHSLARLHAELTTAADVDPTSETLLREVLADIERVLKQTPAAKTEADPGSPGARAHVPRLEALAIEFEAQHPTLAGGLRQLVDLLARAGL